MVILNNHLCLALSVAALLAFAFLRLPRGKYTAPILSVAGFLCGLSAIIYAILLGAELKEILLYSLVFALAACAALLSFNSVAVSGGGDNGIGAEAPDPENADGKADANKGKAKGNDDGV